MSSSPGSRPEQAERHTLGVLAALAAAALLAVARPDRGWNLWYLWQVENAERFAAWWRNPGREAMQAAFEQGPRLFPLPGLLAGLVPAGSADAALRALSALGLMLAAGAVFDVAARRRGPLAGALGVAALLLTPRTWSAVELYPSTMLMAGLMAVVFAAVVRHEAFRLRLATGLAALGLGLLTGLAGWWALPWAAFLLLAGPRVAQAPGVVGLHRDAWPRLVALGSTLLVAAVAVPYFWHSTGSRWSKLMSAWLSVGAEPVLLGGVRYGAERVPLTVVPQLLHGAVAPLFEIAAVLLVLSALSRLVRRRLHSHDLRLAAALLWWMLLPWVLRSPFHGGFDLVVLSLPFAAMALGCGLASAVGRLSRVAGGAVAAVVTSVALVASVVDVAHGWREPEGFGAGWYGRTAGVVESGRSRAAHAPLSARWLAEQSGGRPVAIALPSNAWEWQPLVNAYRDRGWLHPDVRIVPVEQAEVVLFCFEDLFPERLRLLLDAVRALKLPEVSVVRSGDVPLAAWIPVGPAAAAEARSGGAATKAPPSKPRVIRPGALPKVPAMARPGAEGSGAATGGWPPPSAGSGAAEPPQ